MIKSGILTDSFAAVHPEVARLVEVYDPAQLDFLQPPEEVVEYPLVGAVLLKGAMDPEFTFSMIQEGEEAGFELVQGVPGQVIREDERHTTGIYCMGAPGFRVDFARPHKQIFPNTKDAWTYTLINKYLDGNEKMLPHTDGLVDTPSLLTGYGEGGILIDPNRAGNTLEHFVSRLARGKLLKIVYGSSDLLFFDGRNFMHKGYRKGKETRYSVVVTRQLLHK